MRRPPPAGLAVALNGHCGMMKESCDSGGRSTRGSQRIHTEAKEPRSLRTEGARLHEPYDLFEEEVRSHLVGLDRKMEAHFTEFREKLELVQLQVNSGFDSLSVDLRSCWRPPALEATTHAEAKPPHSKEVPREGGFGEDGEAGFVSTDDRSVDGADKSPKPYLTASEAQAQSGSSRKRRASISSSMSSIGFSTWDLDFIKRSRPSKWKQYIWNVLEDPDSGTVARWFPRIWSFVIVASSLVSLMENVKTFPLRGFSLTIVELTFDIVFSAELLLRFFVRRSYVGFFTNIHSAIDFVATLPIILRIYCLATAEDAERSQSMATLMCIIPLLRLLKVMRHVHHFHLFIRLLDETRSALTVLLFLLLLIVISFSTVIYMVEPRDNVESLPKAMYLIIVTISTVGYGDVTPTTTGGLLAVCCIIPCSVLYMSMPIGIVGNAFTRIWSDRDRILLTIKTRERLKEWGYTAADTKMLLRHFDSNRNGELNLNEFRQMVAEMRLSIKDERVVELFDSFDKDGSGEIDPKEFTRLLFPSTFYELLDRKESKNTKDVSAGPMTPQPPSHAMISAQTSLHEAEAISEGSKMNGTRSGGMDSAADVDFGDASPTEDHGVTASKWRVMAAPT
mmetsp:Transcript_110966/g.294869  ORF Transcript_110966/g.294869 Transcript_110966/m.294869 type:complete len:621 (-) Transcript_110966:106-1968(-)|eukprot:CAMPEP_0171181388 /NCGR_PEP_ID=MMETSP0790-20130122/14235_1 /TAXON_ID=2925 /ORGANISM="Alexandrium catenella, Strain OF101" /LENGTH=620 /DNA_ID=CAMNT_0011646327 /DNA_START=70 /DNA_END=1932 /DNA_ORIENTATION=-